MLKVCDFYQFDSAKFMRMRKCNASFQLSSFGDFFRTCAACMIMPQGNKYQKIFIINVL